MLLTLFKLATSIHIIAPRSKVLDFKSQIWLVLLSWSSYHRFNILHLRSRYSENSFSILGGTKTQIAKWLHNSTAHVHIQNLQQWCFLNRCSAFVFSVLFIPLLSDKTQHRKARTAGNTRKTRNAETAWALSSAVEYKSRYCKFPTIQIQNSTKYLTHFGHRHQADNFNARNWYKCGLQKDWLRQNRLQDVCSVLTNPFAINIYTDFKSSASCFQKTMKPLLQLSLMGRWENQATPLEKWYHAISRQIIFCPKPKPKRDK